MEHNIIKSRLRELGMTIEQFGERLAADGLEAPTSTLKSWVSGLHQPKAEKARAIERVLGIEIPQKERSRSRLALLLEARGWSQNRLAKEMARLGSHITRQAVSRWVRGSASPSKKSNALLKRLSFDLEGPRRVYVVAREHGLNIIRDETGAVLWSERASIELGLRALERLGILEKAVEIDSTSREDIIEGLKKSHGWCQ